jgi:hypothetical protein
MVIRSENFLTDASRMVAIFINTTRLIPPANIDSWARPETIQPRASLPLMQPPRRVRREVADVEHRPQQLGLDRDRYAASGLPGAPSTLLVFTSVPDCLGDVV